MGRVLALDLGTRRIGLAMSDELNLTAQGLPTLVRRTLQWDLDELTRIAAAHGVDRILLGDPRRMDGEPGTQSEWTREFAIELETRLGLPVEMWDERLTSREAERMLRGSHIANSARKAAIDRISAVILLQSYLDSNYIQTHGWKPHQEPPV
jgi:putative Holliday junction resolvase